MAPKYGFWTFGQQNGLEGAASTWVTLPDGQRVLQPDATFPAVLQDEFILDALQRSPQARNQFTALFPTLDPRSQQRLTDFLIKYRSLNFLVRDEKDFLDSVQKAAIYKTVPIPNQQSYKG